MTNTTPALKLSAQVTPRLATYVALLPLGVRELDDTLVAEATANPWLELSRRPLDDTEFAGRTAAVETLADHLLVQCAAKTSSPATSRAMHAVIAGLDAQGYLRESLDTIARAARVSRRVAENALAIVQSLDPAGVAARDLGERFRIQLRDAVGEVSAADALSHRLDQLAAEGRETVMASLGLSGAQFAVALETLHALDPYPARGFGSRPDYVIPELVFERRDAVWSARVDDRLWPTLAFVPLTTSSRLSPPMRSARSRAIATIDALERRRATLHRLGEAIVASQAAFLDSGGEPRALAPLTGRDLAQAVGCSEATISRALGTRYAQTPFGTLPLRSFIAARPRRLAVTTAAVHLMLREMISAEGERNLSDAKLTRALALRGVRLSRRTVAKYRAALSLPSTRARHGAMDRA